jgi:hypothetical protein
MVEFKEHGILRAEGDTKRLGSAVTEKKGL